MDTNMIDDSIDDNHRYNALLTSAVAVIILAGTIIGAITLLADNPNPPAGRITDSHVLVSVHTDADVLNGDVHASDPGDLCRVGPGPAGQITRVDDGFGATTPICTQLLPDGSGRQYP